MCRFHAKKGGGYKVTTEVKNSNLVNQGTRVRLRQMSSVTANAV